MIARDLRPAAIIEGEGFKRLLSFLEPGYVIPSRGVRHLLKSCTRFRNQLDFQLISDFKLDFSDFQAPEINGDLAKMLV